MKKFFTLIAFTSACIPALHGMDTNLPVDIQKKYDNLTVLIQNAGSVSAFKPAFNALTLPAESVAALRQTVAETKVAVSKELDAMGDKNKNWSKIIKGGLASVSGTIAGLSGAIGLIHSLNGLIIFNVPMGNFIANNLFLLGAPCIIPPALLNAYITKLSKTAYQSATAITSLLYLGAAYKGLTYGPKTLKAGWNYKEHLQNMLANLDAIDAHIMQVKA